MWYFSFIKTGNKIPKNDASPTYCKTYGYACFAAQGKRSPTTTSNPVDYPSLDLFDPEKRFAKMRIHPMRMLVRTRQHLEQSMSVYYQPIIVCLFFVFFSEWLFCTFAKIAERQLFRCTGRWLLRLSRPLPHIFLLRIIEFNFRFMSLFYSRWLLVCIPDFLWTLFCLFVNY